MAAGPATITDDLTLYGAIAVDATRVREVGARFPGVIRSVSRQVGDRERAGETLAMIESNESLQTYTVTAPIAGVVTERHAAPGEQTDSTPLFALADFSTVWAELDVFSRDRARLREGLPVTVAAEGGATATATISAISFTSIVPPSPLDASDIIVIQNGHPTATTSAPVDLASAKRVAFTRAAPCSSSFHI